MKRKKKATQIVRHLKSLKTNILCKERRYSAFTGICSTTNLKSKDKRNCDVIFLFLHKNKANNLFMAAVLSLLCLKHFVFLLIKAKLNVFIAFINIAEKITHFSIFWVLQHQNSRTIFPRLFLVTY